jgi:hypothetical protein
VNSGGLQTCLTSWKFLDESHRISLFCRALRLPVSCTPIRTPCVEGDVYAWFCSDCIADDGACGCGIRLGNTMKTLTVKTDSSGPSLYSFDSSAQDRLNMGWVSQEFLFTATGSATTLQFLSTTQSVAFGPALDEVRVTDVTRGGDTPTAVPEPASLVLLGSGFLGLARRKLRRIEAS